MPRSFTVTRTHTPRASDPLPPPPLSLAFSVQWYLLTSEPDVNKCKVPILCNSKHPIISERRRTFFVTFQEKWSLSAAFSCMYRGAPLSHLIIYQHFVFYEALFCFADIVTTLSGATKRLQFQLCHLGSWHLFTVSDQFDTRCAKQT